MVDGIVVVGARALHELVKVARRVLLGLSARVICRGDQRGVGRLATILSVLLSPLCGGALVLILALGLALVLAFVEDRSDRLLGGGVVCGDVKQVTGGTGLQTVELVDQGVAGCPREERTNDVRVDDIKKGVTLL